MFDSGNIQGRPTPAFYQKTRLNTRTWNVGAALGGGVDLVNYNLVVVDGDGAGSIAQSVGRVAGSITTVKYQSITLESNLTADESSEVSGQLVTVDYVNTLLDSAEKSEQPARIYAGLITVIYDQVVTPGSTIQTQSAQTSAILKHANYEIA